NVRRLAGGWAKLRMVSCRIRRPPMNGHSPRSTFTNWSGSSWYWMAPFSTRMRGWMLSMVNVWPDADSRPSKSVKCTVPRMPVTGPKGAARPMSLVVKSPVDVAFSSFQPPHVRRLEGGAKAYARHVENRLAVAGRDAVVDGDIADLGAAVRMQQR